jgi:uncharacterized protein
VRRLAGVMALVLAVGACGAAASARRPASLGRPPRVLVLGDSVMFDASLAIVAALSAAGATVDNEPYLGMGLTKTDLYDWRAHWPGLLAAARPDLVVVLLGAWDLPGGGGPATAAVPAAWSSLYEADVAEAARLLTGAGARVVWIGLPWIRDLASRQQVAALDDAFRTVAGRVAGVTFVDGAAVLAGPDGGYAEHLPGPGGRPERVRKLDGVHLCPAGAARLAAAVVAAVRGWWGLRPVGGWQAGPWRADGRYSAERGCVA